MKIVRFDHGATGLLAGDASHAVVLDVVASLPALDPRQARLLEALLPAPDASWNALIEHWETARPAMRALERLALEPSGQVAVRDASGVELEAPLPEPAARIFAMGGNFPAHVLDSQIEMPDSVRFGSKDDTPPWGFYVIPGTTVGPEAEIRPPAQAQKVDYEAEVAIVLGGPLRNGTPLPVWGYTAWNDYSIRDAAFGLSKTDHGPLTWSLCKNFPTANACGPVLVVDADVDVQDLRLSCRVNGQIRQDGSTAGMTWSFAEVAGYIDSFLPLDAGDMILSGTPSGTAMEGGVDGPFLTAGDVVEVEVEGVGVLRNRVGELSGRKR